MSDVKIIQTSIQDGKKETTINEKRFAADTKNQELTIINIYPSETFQTILGFGGAFTEAAGYVYSKVSDKLQRRLIHDYFGEDGLGYVLGRCPIDSCDFALGNYSAVTDPDDLELKTFSLKRDEKYIFPLLDDARASASDLKLMLSPWSPPAYMKSNGEKNNGGTLIPEYRKIWANYLSRYISAYKQRGCEVFGLSVQNEPNAVQRWDSCLFTPEEEKVFVRDYLWESLESDGNEAINVIVWDHNKERLFDRTDEICSDVKANEAVGGVGFHWYSGDHFEAIELVRRKYPDKLLIFTEGCIEYSKFSADSQLKNAQMYGHEIIGSLNAGMQAFFDWNLFLNKEGGPNHVDNFCDAPIMLDDGNEKEEEQIIYNLSYAYIGHFSRYIKPGAQRIGFSRYTNQLEVTAFKNVDKSVVVVIMNPSSTEHDFFLRLNHKLCPVNMPGQTIATVIIEADE